MTEAGWRVVVHGGVETPDSDVDGCRVAVDAILDALRGGASSLDAAVEGTARLEDHPGYNAGTGASFRLDGQTIELDAALMDEQARIGAVGAIQRVRHPIRVARQVLDSPHILLVGPAATRFARNFGHEEYDNATDDSRRAFARVSGQLARGELPEWRRRWLEIDLERHWNFDAPYRACIATEVSGDGRSSTDTVGAVVTDGEGFAVALSTGGASPMLAGRIGDTPLPGAGFWASELAAVATTGVGEEIARRLLARWIHARIEVGEDPQSACEAGVAWYPATTPIGALAVTRDGLGCAANKEMAWAAWTGQARADSVVDRSKTRL